MSQNNKPDWIVISSISIVLMSLFGLGVSEYLSFLTEREKINTIKAAIEKDWPVEQIQGWINSKP